MPSLKLKEEFLRDGFNECFKEGVFVAPFGEWQAESIAKRRGKRVCDSTLRCYYCVSSGWPYKIYTPSLLKTQQALVKDGLWMDYEYKEVFLCPEHARQIDSLCVVEWEKIKPTAKPFISERIKREDFN
mgnify:CR=1 FL=1